MDAATIKLLAAGLCYGFRRYRPRHRRRSGRYGSFKCAGTQPGSQRPIMTYMILAIAMAEAVAIYALVIAVVLNFCDKM